MDIKGNGGAPKYDEVIIGATIKLNVYASFCTNDISLSECEFYVDVWADDKSKKRKFPKQAMIESDEDNFIIVIDSTLLGTGVVWAEVHADVPDDDCISDEGIGDGIRKEIWRGETSVKIIE